MHKIRTLLVDDEPIARRGIRQQLQQETDVEIIGECANGQEAVAAIRTHAPDLVFLDVQMPLLNGFGVVEEIGVDQLPAVVFVTAYDEHAIRAFEVNALDYLLKPIEPRRFQKTLSRVRVQLVNSSEKQLTKKLSALLDQMENAEALIPNQPYLQRVVIKEHERVVMLPVDDIDWIAAHGNYVQIHTRSKTHLLRETMDGMGRKLNPANFVRLRRSTIVNAERVRELKPLFNGDYSVFLKNGVELTSSRRYRKNLDVLLKP
ncbi:MAG TPA: LytTR family transcriptional regulator DNA-binding domain-containing protein [Pyrinomonadaceae bacterium]|nr:LytTR family transcriptional regulator DNA-binding domain-containing protein [Pyrinomonadaceae bacterium]